MAKHLCWFLLISAMVFTVKSQVSGLCDMRIVFVLDSSGTISPSEWITIKGFVQTIANSVGITQDAGQRKAGLVRFDNTNSQLKFTCASMPTKAVFDSTVTNLQKLGVLTDILNGLKAGREVLMDCSQDATTQKVAKYIVIMTDGEHNRPIGSTYNDIYTVANQIRADGAVIYGVGIGERRQSEMNTLTDNKLFSVAQFSDLTELLAKNISDEIKQCLPIITTTTTTTPTTTTTTTPTTTTTTTTPTTTTTTTPTTTTTTPTTTTTTTPTTTTTTPTTTTTTTPTTTTTTPTTTTTTPTTTTTTTPTTTTTTPTTTTTTPTTTTTTTPTTTTTTPTTTTTTPTTTTTTTLTTTTSTTPTTTTTTTSVPNEGRPSCNCTYDLSKYNCKYDEYYIQTTYTGNCSEKLEAAYVAMCKDIEELEQLAMQAENCTRGLRIQSVTVGIPGDEMEQFYGRYDECIVMKRCKIKDLITYLTLKKVGVGAKIKMYMSGFLDTKFLLEQGW